MAVFRLAKFIGLGHIAKRLILFSEQIHAQEAKELGFVDEISNHFEDSIAASYKRPSLSTTQRFNLPKTPQ